MLRRARRSLRCLLVALPAALAAGKVAAAGFADDGSTEPRIAIIIDDLGYELAAGRRAVGLPGPVACAVLPATPRGRALAELAASRGKEVLLHLPLEAQNAAHRRDPGDLRLDMSRRQFAAAFAASLESVPHAAGVNSHRGSLLTRHPGHMGWLMEEINARGGLFFVDSYTTKHSIALESAGEAGVPALRRDVFLDSDRGAAAIARAFERLKQRALRQGAAVGIGHPYPETLDFLELALPRLGAEGFTLVPLRSLVEPSPPAATIEPRVTAPL